MWERIALFLENARVTLKGRMLQHKHGMVNSMPHGKSAEQCLPGSLPDSQETAHTETTLHRRMEQSAVFVTGRHHVTARTLHSGRGRAAARLIQQITIAVSVWKHGSWGCCDDGMERLKEDPEMPGWQKEIACNVRQPLESQGKSDSAKNDRWCALEDV